MPAFTLFDAFAVDLGLGLHDFTSDSYRLALCGAANMPDGANDSRLADLTTIDMANIDAASLDLVISTWVGAAGVADLVVTDPAISVTGGPSNAFRGVVVYNATATGGPLVGFLDLGADAIVSEAAPLSLNFDTDNDMLFSLTVNA